MLEPAVAIRDKMHELYKYKRAANGAQLHADIAPPGAEPMTTDLGFAAKDGRVETVERLLEELEITGAPKLAQLNAKSGDSGGTPLFMACQNGHTDVVQLLLYSQADLDQQTPGSGTTPLFVGSQNGHTDVVKLLLDAKANPSRAKKGTGSTPLWIAAQNGHTDVVQLLLAVRASRFLFVSTVHCSSTAPVLP